MAGKPELKSSVEKLMGEVNWTSWRFDMDLQLTVHKVRKIVTGDWVEPDEDSSSLATYGKKLNDFEEADGLVRYLIRSSVAPSVKQYILTCKSGKEMWDVLHSIYEQKNERRLDMLYSQLFSYTKDPADSIAVHISKLQKVWQDLQEELKVDKVQLPTSMLLNRVLNTLPMEYLEFNMPGSQRL